MLKHMETVVKEKKKIAYIVVICGYSRGYHTKPIKHLPKFHKREKKNINYWNRWLQGSI